jgi:uncharacterized surface protein with fasciclin (FAS1) repeats
MFRQLITTVTAVALFSTGALSYAKPDAKKAARTPNLAQVAVEVNTSGAFAGQFSTLIAIVMSDDEIAEILTSVGQQTVFAPTNAAFDGLFAAAAENCVDLNPDLVNAVVKYHLVKGRRSSDDVLASSQLRTLLGAFFAQSGGLITDGADEVATIIATDIPATNGYIHALDKVLLPFPLPNQCEA